MLVIMVQLFSSSASFQCDSRRHPDSAGNYVELRRQDDIEMLFPCDFNYPLATFFFFFFFSFALQAKASQSSSPLLPLGGFHIHKF